MPALAHQGETCDPEDVLAFWLDELSPKDWYNANETIDAKIRDTFGATWEAAQDGAFSLWLTYPSGALAYVILNDQMPRNMFRGEAKAFSSDRAALAAAKVAIEKGWDLKIDPPARQFFYLPLMHSESMTDQDHCVRLMHMRLDSPDNLRHAQAHREVIRKFGRFPYRNAALGRTTSQAETKFMEDGGYQTILSKVA